MVDMVLLRGFTGTRTLFFVDTDLFVLLVEVAVFKGLAVFLGAVILEGLVAMKGFVVLAGLVETETFIFAAPLPVARFAHVLPQLAVGRARIFRTGSDRMEISGAIRPDVI